ncbi:MAG: tetratricopeptide repeat protein [Desulfobacteraceae bacterium]|jgi:tetratricopeptide (TPR) repeat protein|nr:tetratricopeptide repeat protein [Desulfobacteraceae bacterium]
MSRCFRAERLLAKGQRAAAAGDPAAALAFYEHALARCADYAPAHLYRGISFSMQQDHAAAVASVQRAVNRDPQRPAYRLMQGMVAYDAGDLPAAITAFEAASQMSPGNRLAAAYARLAAIRRDLPRPDPGHLAALAALMASANPAFQARWLVLCESALADGRSRGRTLAEQMIAATYLEVPAEPRQPLWAGRISRWISTLGGFTPARRAALVLVRQAEMRLAEGDCDGALEKLAAALQQRPGAEHLLDRYLDICLYQGRYAPILDQLGTQEEIERLAHQPDVHAAAGGNALLLLGVVRFHQKSAAAIPLLEAAAAADPLDYLAPYFLGVSFLCAADLPAARQWFQKAVSQINPNIAALRLAEWRRCLGTAVD